MATTTINTTGAEDARLVVAFGKYLNLGRSATQGEIVADLRRYMTQVVRESEAGTAIAAAVAGVTNIAPT